jgi:hypothetical protein
MKQCQGQCYVKHQLTDRVFYRLQMQSTGPKTSQLKCIQKCNKLSDEAKHSHNWPQISGWCGRRRCFLPNYMRTVCLLNQTSTRQIIVAWGSPTQPRKLCPLLITLWTDNIAAELLQCANLFKTTSIRAGSTFILTSCPLKRRYRL